MKEETITANTDQNIKIEIVRFNFFRFKCPFVHTGEITITNVP